MDYITSIEDSLPGVVPQAKLEAILTLRCSYSLSWNLAWSQYIDPSSNSQVLVESNYGEHWGVGCGAWMLALKDERYCLAEGWLVSNGTDPDAAGTLLTSADNPKDCLSGPIQHVPPR